MLYGIPTPSPTPVSSGSAAQDMSSSWRRFWSGIYYWYCRNLRRHIPHLVWPGQEVDVRVRFREDPISPDSPFETFFSGGLYDVEKLLRHMGIDFDTGQGAGGRDWEWDYALRGPISVTFKGVAARPELRKRPPTPKLVINNTSAA